jgi:hypothetical protein
MSYPRCWSVVVFLLVAAFAPSLDADDLAALAPRVRATDARLDALLHAGLAGSRSLRELVERLNGADVVVYVRCARLPSHIEGQLTFVSAAGGWRYVLVQIALGRTLRRTIATLGHELQHAVEIAEHPAIVDSASLARAFGGFGFAREGVRGNGTAFDTAAAIAAGNQVWQELAAARAADE